MSENIRKRDEERFDAASKEYAFALLYTFKNKNDISILASPSPRNLVDVDCSFEYFMEFKKEGESMKVFRGSNLNPSTSNTSWVINLSRVTVLEDVARYHFTKIANLWKAKYLKLLRGEPLGRFVPEDTDILKSLKPMETRIYVHDFFSLATSRQKDLAVYWERSCHHYSTTTINKVQTYLYMPFISFTYKHFVILSAARVNLHIGSLTPENLVDFIKAWKDGKVRENFEWLILNTSYSTFDREKLWTLLGGDIDKKSEPIEIKQSSGRAGRLYQTDEEIRFICDESKLRAEAEDTESDDSDKTITPSLASRISKNLNPFSKSQKKKKEVINVILANPDYHPEY